MCLYLYRITVKKWEIILNTWLYFWNRLSWDLIYFPKWICVFTEQFISRDFLFLVSPKVDVVWMINYLHVSVKSQTHSYRYTLSIINVTKCICNATYIQEQRLIWKTVYAEKINFYWPNNILVFFWTSNKNLIFLPAKWLGPLSYHCIYKIYLINKIVRW